MGVILNEIDLVIQDVLYRGARTSNELEVVPLADWKAVM